MKTKHYKKMTEGFEHSPMACMHLLRPQYIIKHVALYTTLYNKISNVWLLEEKWWFLNVVWLYTHHFFMLYLAHNLTHIYHRYLTSIPMWYCHKNLDVGESELNPNLNSMKSQVSSQVSSHETWQRCQVSWRGRQPSGGPPDAQQDEGGGRFGRQVWERLLGRTIFSYIY